eukprot:Rmarinus@m.23759
MGQGQSSHDLISPYSSLSDSQRNAVLKISGNIKNFLEAPAGGCENDFSLDQALADILALQALDSHLGKVQSALIPRRLSEEEFWRNYLSCVRRTLRDVPAAPEEVDPKSCEAHLPGTVAGVAKSDQDGNKLEYTAVLVSVNAQTKEYETNITRVSKKDFPPGNIFVRAEYSSINYRDALAVLHMCKVVRSFPMVPGMDMVGVVEESDSGEFKKGDKVFVSCQGLGETHWGGYATAWRGDSAMALRVPDKLDTHHAAALGSPSVVAGLAVDALRSNGIHPEGGTRVLVTGASGGVGSFTVAFLSSLGYVVVAATGRRKHSEAKLLKHGASEVVDRASLMTSKPLAVETFDAVVDVVGGSMLVCALASVKYGGVVVSCGFAESMQFHGSLAPFVLRAVRLVGIDAVRCPMALRRKAWEFVTSWALEGENWKKVDAIAAVMPLQAVQEGCRALVEGRVIGRVVVETRPRPAHRVIFVLGGPGAGKGTQCARLVKEYGFRHLSAGDLLRAEIKSGSEQGEMIAHMIKEGQIVPGHITIGLLKAAMSSHPGDTFLIDGFPREMQQAHDFEDQVCECSLTLYFDCPEDALQQRLLKRGETSGRSDDNLESIKKRIRTFHETSMPVVSMLAARGKVQNICSAKPPDQVYSDVVSCLRERELLPSPDVGVVAATDTDADTDGDGDGVPLPEVDVPGVRS